MSGERPPPDFAMLRAVELLEQMHRAQRRRPAAAETLAEPARLHSPRISFCVGDTTRTQVERELGVAFSYPARGWHTYATRESGTRCFASLFYKSEVLIAAEIYVPAVQHAPALAAADFGGFELLPRGVRIGMDASRAFEAQFPGGAVYVKARSSSIDRIAIYASPAGN